MVVIGINDVLFKNIVDITRVLIEETVEEGNIISVLLKEKVNSYILNIIVVLSRERLNSYIVNNIVVLYKEKVDRYIVKNKTSLKANEISWENIIKVIIFRVIKGTIDN